MQKLTLILTIVLVYATTNIYLELKQLNSATEDIRQLLLTNTN